MSQIEIGDPNCFLTGDGPGVLKNKRRVKVWKDPQWDGVKTAGVTRASELFSIRHR